MTRFIKHRLIGMLAFLLMCLSNRSHSQNLELPEISIHDFTLANCHGTTTSLSSFNDAKGFIVVFTCNHCPFAKLYTKRLNRLHQRYKDKGYPLIAINSMDSMLYREESLDTMRTFAAEQQFKFEYLQDGTQAVGKMFGTKHTPQAFVIQRDGDAWIVRYSGSIDSNGEQPRKATPYIANAVDDLLSGKKVTEPMTSTYGCKIFYRKE